MAAKSKTRPLPEVLLANAARSTDRNVSEVQKTWSSAAEDSVANADKIYRTHGNWLLAFLRRRFAPQEAEDLAQDTYVQLVTTKADIQNPRAFLARLALDAAGMQARRRQSRPILVSDDLIPAGFAEPSEQEHALLLKQAILSLPPKLREVFLLSRVGGLTYDRAVAHKFIGQEAVLLVEEQHPELLPRDSREGGTQVGLQRCRGRDHRPFA